MVAGIEAGKRIIIGGGSPNIFHLPAEILNTGPVIGVNKWYKVHPERMDYWICADTGAFYRDFKDDIPLIKCPKFMRKRQMTDPEEACVPEGIADFWFETTPGFDLPCYKWWDESLRMVSTTATAAIDLARIMGASEIVLYGVDICGRTHFDGEDYGFDWTLHAEQFNRLLRELKKYVPIYKTNPDSPIDCPMLEF